MNPPDTIAINALVQALVAWAAPDATRLADLANGLSDFVSSTRLSPTLLASFEQLGASLHDQAIEMADDARAA